MSENREYTEHNLKLQAEEGGELLYERTGMLVVSLRGVNCRFWSRLGCSGQNTNIFTVAAKVSFRVAREEILKNCIFSICLIYSSHVIKV